jgi:DNA-binding response OmpR family regulator
LSSNPKKLSKPHFDVDCNRRRATQIEGLNFGADDYIKKPIDPDVLLARVNALLRRCHVTSNTEKLDMLQFGKLTIYISARRVTLEHVQIELANKEYELLLLLAQNAGTVLHRNTITKVLQGIDYDPFSSRVIDLRIAHLRAKLRDDKKQPYRIKTVWGKGYLFVATAWDQS